MRRHIATLLLLIILLAVSMAQATPTLAQSPLPIPSDFQVVAKTTNSITVSWSPVADAIDYYLHLNTRAEGATTETSYIFTGLQANTNYFLEVLARSPQGVASNSQSAGLYVTTAPSPLPIPSDFRVVAKTTNSITVSWSPVADAIDYYLHLNTRAEGATTETSYTFTGLQANTLYFLEVLARSPQGVASNSQSAGLYETTEPSPLPIPSDFRVVAKTTNSITVSWSPVANAIDYYLHLNTRAEGATTETSYTFTGLQANTLYFLEVLARSPQGVASNSQSAGLYVTTASTTSGTR